MGLCMKQLENKLDKDVNKCDRHMIILLCPNINNKNKKKRIFFLTIISENLNYKEIMETKPLILSKISFRLI